MQIMQIEKYFQTIQESSKETYLVNGCYARLQNAAKTNEASLVQKYVSASCQIESHLIML